VRLEQVDFGDATDMEALTAEDRWLLLPLCLIQHHRQFACDVNSTGMLCAGVCDEGGACV
jgi:hypothetical protein